MQTDADYAEPRPYGPTATWGPLGAPGTRSKEAIVDYVKRNSGLGPEGKRLLAVNLWRGELAFRSGEQYDPMTMTPYGEG